MQTLFEIRGPFAYPGRKFLASDVRSFWSDHEDLKPLRGCYIFGIRSGPGLTPGYVGKTRRRFEKEVFNPHQQRRYYEFLQDHPTGTPVFIFAVLPRKRGKPNAKHIGELEKFLIQTSVAANPELTNVQYGTHMPQWGIRGVLRDGAGRPTAPAQALKRMLNLTTKPGKAPQKRTEARAPTRGAAVPANRPQPKLPKRQNATTPKARDPRFPAAGTTIKREYKGKEIRVLVLEDGFRWDGKEYRSLSALATEICGNSANGFLFFKLIERKPATPTTPKPKGKRAAPKESAPESAPAPEPATA